MRTTRSATRGRAALEDGLRLSARGPAPDAFASLWVARRVPAATSAQTLAATLTAADVAWAAGDHPACVAAYGAALDAVGDEPGFLRDYLRGTLALLAERRQDARAPLARAVAAGSTAARPDVLVRTAGAALLLGDVRAAARAAALALAGARAAADEATAVQASAHLASAELRSGRHALAREHAVAGLRAARRRGLVNAEAHHHAVLALAASVQDPAETVRRHAAAALAIARRNGLAQPVTLAEWARARLEVREGDDAAAADRLRSLLDVAGGAHFALRGLVLPLYAEAALTAGREDLARAVLPELHRWSSQAADPQTPALELRVHALVADDDATDGLFERAHRAHAAAQGDFERARTLLLHGRSLRRRRRPVDARERLRAALVLFERCGAPPWSEVTTAELRSAGATAGAPAGRADGRDALAGLTPHQRRIARLVAAGDTNREIAARLSVSVRTVDCHLRNVFVALGVRSRVELARRVPRDDDG